MALDRAFPGRVIFDHLQKTAGQALNAWLSGSLGSACVTPNLIGYHRELIQKYGGLYSIISAHVLFRADDELDPRYQYMTVFRDPVDRAVSWMYFLLNDVPADKYTTALIEGAHLFLESHGRDSTKEFLESITNPYTEHFCSFTRCMDEDKVAAAFSVIQRYDVIGIYEEMPRFIADVAAMIGLPTPDVIPRVNVTTNGPKRTSYRQRCMSALLR